MAVIEASAQTQDRLRRLRGYLELDPDNVPLIADCAQAAFDVADLDLARQLLERWEAAAPNQPAQLNLRGLIALAERRPEAAAVSFAALRAQGAPDPAIAVNLAWALAMLKDPKGALALLDDATVAAAPPAAALKIRLMHRLGLIDEALAAGRAMLARQPHDRPLMAALSTLALDGGDLDLAKTCAESAGDLPESQATLGLLALNEERLSDAGALFDAALSATPDNARAQLGKGLELLAMGEATVAARHIEQAARLFERHLGSWIAAGWAYFVAGDIPAARRCFEHALALDDTFAEAHGALAVLAVLEGRIEEGRRAAAVARRLDRNCLSAALADSLILTRAGRPNAAERVREIALTRPVGDSGKTIAQAMAKLAIANPKRPSRP